jgi:hypothetical protein
MTNHLFQKIRDAVEGQESRLFLETPAGIALTYAGIIFSSSAPPPLREKTHRAWNHSPLPKSKKCA